MPTSARPQPACHYGAFLQWSHLQYPHLAQQGGQERRFAAADGAHHHQQLPAANLRRKQVVRSYTVFNDATQGQGTPGTASQNHQQLSTAWSAGEWSVMKGWSWVSGCDILLSNSFNQVPAGRCYAGSASARLRLCLRRPMRKWHHAR